MMTETTGGRKADRDQLIKLNFDPKWVEKISDARVGRVMEELRRREREKAKAREKADQ